MSCFYHLGGFLGGMGASKHYVDKIGGGRVWKSLPEPYIQRKKP